jgi:flagellar FliL protein
MSTLAVPSPAEGPAAAEADDAKKSKKKLFLILAVLLLLGAGGGAAWYFLLHKAEDPKGEAHKVEAPHAGPPVFVVMDPFTVNLQPDGQFLQATFTLQMLNPEESNNIKVYMPQVRSRLLLMLSNKSVTDLSSVEGKNSLATEIAALIEQPFAEGVKPVKVSNVFFTSFVIQ